MLLLQLLSCYCSSDIVFCYNCYYVRVIDIPRTRRHCYAETTELLLLTSFAAVTTPVAYADASVARVALLTVSKVIFYCYRRCYDANCYYESDIARRVPGQTATLLLLLLTSFVQLLQRSLTLMLVWLALHY